MKLHQIAAQLYTLRDHCQNSAALADSARKLRQIGYQAVQVSGIGPIPDAEVARIMAGEGLVICATHEPSATILDEPDRAAERLLRLGCKLTAYPYPRDVDLYSEAGLSDLIRRLEAAGARFRAHGLTLGYHNHALEFVRSGPATVLDAIFSRTNPDHLVAEIDTYWVQYGGGDVLAWVRKLHGRLPFIHLKDYVFTQKNEPAFGEIGAGNLDFPHIIAEAEAGGCEWFIVEQDVCLGDPFDSLRRSLEYLKTLLASPGV